MSFNLGNNNQPYIGKEYEKHFNDIHKINITKRKDINRMIEYYKDNLELRRTYNQNYYKENKEKLKERNRQLKEWRRSWGWEDYTNCGCSCNLLMCSVEVFS